MHIVSIGEWNVHLELDWAIWLLGASWHVDDDSGDIGIYFAPVNVQFEHYDRGVDQEPKPDDAVNDPWCWDDLPRAAAEHRGDAVEAAKFADMSDLALVARDKTGVPMDVYIARNLGGHAYDPRLYIPTCDCPVHGRADLQPIAISPRVRLVRGVVTSSADFRKLARWIKLNRPTLLAHWNEKIGSNEAVHNLKPVH